MSAVGKPIADVRSPMLLRAHTYWQTIRGAKTMPCRADLDPLDIPDLLPYVILLDVLMPDGRLKVRLVGTFVVAMYDGDYTGMYLDEVDFGGIRSKVLADYAGAVRAAAPVFSDHGFRSLNGGLFDIERVILPISEDGERVSMALFMA